MIFYIFYIKFSFTLIAAIREAGLAGLGGGGHLALPSRHYSQLLRQLLHLLGQAARGPAGPGPGKLEANYAGTQKGELRLAEN